MPQRIFEVSQLSGTCPSRTVSSSRFSLIIPAAGRGSRLGYSGPKVLFPILGRPILSWLLENFRPYVNDITLVLSPEGEPVVSRYLNQENITGVKIRIQPEPLGMAHAIQCGESGAEAENVAIVWGDQVGLQDETLRACFAVHQNRSTAWLTLPTILRQSPYISFQRDTEGRIIRVFEARESEDRPERGESDCGFFIFNRERLFAELRDAQKTKINVGQKTGEANLLPLIPRFEGPGDEVVCIRTSNLIEAMGVNTPEEAVTISKILAESGRFSGNPSPPSGSKLNI